MKREPSAGQGVPAEQAAPLAAPVPDAAPLTAPPAAALAATRRPRAGWARALALPAVFLATALGLAACGPGLGGTGTGATQDSLAAYGARAVPVCEATFADLLGCALPAAGAAPLPATETRYFAEATPASRTLLELDGQEAQLRLRCAGLVFVGAFGQVGSEAPRYYGNVIEGGTRVRLATLQVQRSGAGLSLTLTDSLGLVVFGPQLLLPVGGVTGEAPCT